MNVSIDQNLQFPLATLTLNAGENVQIANGSMIYHSSVVELAAHMNASGSGAGKFLKAIGRAMTSGESLFITEAVSHANGGFIAIAPAVPGTIKELQVGANQYRLNDGAFLAMDMNVSYTMEKQSFGKALFGGQGGFFVMTTQGQGNMLINAYGSIVEIDLNNSTGLVIDNAHVVAWDTSLEYTLSLEGGFKNSIGTGEGVVNTFRGTGKVFIQTLNLQTFADRISPFLPDQSSS
jgi:uncharacterized protein (TIGR00266 family)